MSEVIAMTDKVCVDESKLNGEDVALAGSSGAGDGVAEPPSASSIEDQDMETVTEGDEAKNEESFNRRKRKASTGSETEPAEDFRGFGDSNLDDSIAEYSRVLERIEAEVTAGQESLTPIRNVTATPTAISKVKKRLRNESDVSRPSSALSAPSDTEGISSSTEVGSIGGASPGGRGRRPTLDMSSPLLRVPMDRGWRRELVYRAALDQHSRRNADIYYYMPSGKKLRSTREIAEHLGGTGLTLENFSFCKEPIGFDDPDKEIIRDAKVMRKEGAVTVSPAPAPVEAKRTPKPKLRAEITSPPAKLKVKSVGARLSNNNTPTAATKQTKPQPKTPSTPDNNNTTAWKKPSEAAPPAVPPAPSPAAPPPVAAPPPTPAAAAAPPPALQPAPTPVHGACLPRPCSVQCVGAGGAVPTLACALCLCLFHASCAGAPPTATLPPGRPFLCINCRKASELPTLVHKTVEPAPTAPPPEKRVTLRMKVTGAGAGGRRVWAVSGAGAGGGGAGGPAAGPQSLATLNGRRFIVVPHHHVYNTPAPHTH